MKINQGDVLERYHILKSSIIVDVLIPTQSKTAQDINLTNDPPHKELDHAVIKNTMIGPLVDKMDQSVVL